MRVRLGLDPNMRVRLGLDPDMRVRLGLDPDMRVRLGLDTDMSVRLGLDPDMRVRLGLDPDMRVRLGLDPDMRVRLGLDPDMSVRLGLDPNMSVRLGLDPTMRVRLGLDPDMRASEDSPGGICLGINVCVCVCTSACGVVHGVPWGGEVMEEEEGVEVMEEEGCVLLPLLSVRPPQQAVFLLVDSVDEGCRPGDKESKSSPGSPRTIAELLASHHEFFPPWLLLICSARRQNKAITKLFTGQRAVLQGFEMLTAVGHEEEEDVYT
ncbi:hypothetical protein NHX12_011483 [Muraenolepis orangiensis]|uniref:Uncharacterized protein n=1 Tax=Muraenolepis orangiensis TaxID=630683 RepID=A0A9Q0DG88_9TELE|nr:hypothetical protein NHX12_011483 [Muraenolepis orangiensis]